MLFDPEEEGADEASGDGREMTVDRETERLPTRLQPGKTDMTTIAVDNWTRGNGFTAEVDAADKTQWFEVTREFTDANLFQTWPYEVVRSGPANVSHLLLKHNGSVVAAAQTRIVRLPYLRFGMAYIRWGPMWQKQNGTPDKEVFRQIVRALRNEYVCRRRLAVRLLPHFFDDDNGSYRRVLEEEGYVLQDGNGQYKTIIMDIRPSMEQLYRGLHQKWRNCLNSARKHGLELLEGHDEALFEAFEPIYSEMQDRKQFVNYNDFSQFRRIQNELPVADKMKIVLCKVEGEVCAGAICSALGDTGLYLFGATSNRGMKTNGSYLVHWRIIEWLKQLGCQWYNLNGINPLKNQGTYRFKSRLAGVHGREVDFLGQFDAYGNAAARFIVGLGDALRAKVRSSRARLAHLSGKAAMAPAGVGEKSD
jgi:hypothetical protein